MPVQHLSKGFCGMFYLPLQMARGSHAQPAISRIMMAYHSGKDIGSVRGAV